MNNPYATQQRASLNSAPAEKAEGWALVETARRLEEAKKTPEDRDNTLTAVRLNWRIWTIIQASLVDPDSPLPREIRENLLNLSRFIDKRSAAMIAKPDDIQQLDVLININRQIGAGLLGNPGDERAESTRPNTEMLQSAALGTPTAGNPEAQAQPGSQAAIGKITDA